MKSMLKFDLLKTPFSMKGAFLCIFKREYNIGGGIWVKSLIRPSWGDINKIKPSNLLLKIIPTNSNGNFIDYEVIATPSYIEFITKEGTIKVYFNQYNKLTFILNNLGLVFEYENLKSIRSFNQDNKTIKVKYQHLNQYVNIDFENNVTLNNNLNRIVIKDIHEFNLSFWVNNLKHPKNYDYYYSQDEVLNSYLKFKKHYNIKTQYDELAIYTLWTLSYEACGNFNHNAIAISKNDMSLSWGWDHLMIGLTLVKSNPKLVVDAIKVFFDLQKDDGMLVDAINPVLIVDKYTKPPVYGYFLKEMIKKGLILSLEDKKYFYDVLVKSTNWWMKRDDKFPTYLNPFDSGWDNATCFDEGNEFITPDLVSYVIHQMDFLAVLANELNKEVEFLKWEERKNQLLKNFIDEYYINNEFLYQTSTGKFKTTSLIKTIPIILYKWLNKDIISNLIKELKEENHFLTQKGLATESLKSIKYDTRVGDVTKPNAYWRGPIWSPPLFMIVLSLEELEEYELATLIKNRYLKTLEDSNTFYENYDAISGDGYDDISYGWTAAIYTLLKDL